MSEIKAQSNNSPKGENKYFGFGLAAVFLIIGGVLFFPGVPSVVKLP